jgi:hypothetical protein
MARLLVTIGTATVLTLILAVPRDAVPVSQAKTAWPSEQPK